MKKLDEFSLHEALDRTSNICDIVQRQLVEHQVYKKKKYRKAIKKIANQLADLYQQLGVERFRDSDDTCDHVLRAGKTSLPPGPE